MFVHAAVAEDLTVVVFCHKEPKKDESVSRQC
jgi:hypothetical protein